MIDEIMLHDLDVEDIGAVHMDGLPLGKAQRDPLGGVARDVTQDLFEFEREGIVRQGLDHEVDGVDGVSFQRVVRHIGHEDDGDVRGDLAQLLGRFDAVDPRHIDVEKDDVIGGRKAAQEGGAVLAAGDAQFSASRFLRIAAQKRSKQRGIARVVVNDGDLIHKSPPPLLSFIVP